MRIFILQLFKSNTPTAGNIAACGFQESNHCVFLIYSGVEIRHFCEQGKLYHIAIKINDFKFMLASSTPSPSIELPIRRKLLHSQLCVYTLACLTDNIF